MQVMIVVASGIKRIAVVTIELKTRPNSASGTFF